MAEGDGKCIGGIEVGAADADAESSFRDEGHLLLGSRTVAAYSKHLSSLSRFQTSIMNQLSMAYDAFLPSLAAYCKENRISPKA